VRQGLLEIKNVSKTYGNGSSSVGALKNVSLHIDDGDFVAITGPSGSGKSTLLSVIGGLEKISAGEVILDGHRIDNLNEKELVEIRRKKVSYVFQQYHLIPSLTALENVLLPLTFGGVDGMGRERAAAVLQEVGLEKRVKHKPGQLSGGEQQRVAIARALVNGCSLILADEPTGNVDQKTGVEILKLFRKANEDGHTIIMVTHSPEIARQAKRIVTLRDGEIVDQVDQEGCERQSGKGGIIQ
jgi:ABC-type lipoprotein export system ATPase subunit